MTAAQRKRAELQAKASLKALCAGWSGALISAGDSVIGADSRWRVREACTAARKAVAAGATPREAVLEHLLPAFAVPADEGTA